MIGHVASNGSSTMDSKTIILQPDFWRINELSVEVLPCLDEDVCMGGRNSSDDLCKVSDSVLLFIQSIDSGAVERCLCTGSGQHSLPSKRAIEPPSVHPLNPYHQLKPPIAPTVRPERIHRRSLRAV